MLVSQCPCERAVVSCMQQLYKIIDHKIKVLTDHDMHKSEKQYTSHATRIGKMIY